MNEEAIAQAFEHKVTLWTRLKWKLFPIATRPLNPNDSRTYITTTIWITVDWKDRIRMLILGRAKLQVITYTDIEVKEANSLSVFSVE